MTLVSKNPLDLFVIAGTALIVNAITGDGKMTWFEGMMLIGVYAVLGTAYFYTWRRTAPFGAPTSGGSAIGNDGMPMPSRRRSRTSPASITCRKSLLAGDITSSTPGWPTYVTTTAPLGLSSITKSALRTACA